MSGWAWAGITLALWIGCSPLLGLAIGWSLRRGRKPRPARPVVPHTPAWARRRRTPAWARTDHHNHGRHRR